MRKNLRPYAESSLKQAAELYQLESQGAEAVARAVSAGARADIWNSDGSIWELVKFKSILTNLETYFAHDNKLARCMHREAGKRGESRQE